MIVGKWFNGGGGASPLFWICSDSCSKRISDRVEMEELGLELVEPTPDAICTVCWSRSKLGSNLKQARDRQIDTYSAWMDEAGHRFD